MARAKKKEFDVEEYLYESHCDERDMKEEIAEELIYKEQSEMDWIKFREENKDEI